MAARFAQNRKRSRVLLGTLTEAGSPLSYLTLEPAFDSSRAVLWSSRCQARSSRAHETLPHFSRQPQAWCVLGWSHSQLSLLGTSGIVGTSPCSLHEV